MFEADSFLLGALLQFLGDFGVLWSPSWYFSESMPGTSHLQCAWAPQAPCLLFLQPVGVLGYFQGFRAEACLPV